MFSARQFLAPFKMFFTDLIKINGRFYHRIELKDYV
jgi:hypothetical protein